MRVSQCRSRRVVTRIIPMLRRLISDNISIRASAGGNRAATMWLIKRLAVDHWDVDRATCEAIALGQSSPMMRQFAIDYAQSHRR